MNAWELMRKFKTRSVIIWISCFDKARNMEEVAEVWNYEGSGKVLYTRNVPHEMVKVKLLTIEKVEKRYIYYRSSFNEYFFVLDCWNKEENKMKNEYYDMLIKDKDILLPLIENEYFKKIFMNLETIAKSTNYNREVAGTISKALSFPILGISFLESLKLIENFGIFKNLEKEFNDLKSFVSNLFFSSSGLVQTPDFNVKIYQENISKKLDYETYKILTKGIEKTQSYLYMKELSRDITRSVKYFVKLLDKF